jgi:CheY-like chemotaxis protein
MAVASSVESRPGAKTVLVIDDDPAARDLMQRYLARENINSVTAATGEEGLRLARELHPDLITLDVLMPGMDGWAVLQALKSDAELAGIPVIMASIVTDRGLGYALGATDFLIKPVTRERLAELLRKYHCAHNRCNVLLVDDDAESRSMLRSLLVKEGCDVEEAGDGLQALAAVARSKPQLILLDLLMPNMDGFEFAHELRNRDEWRRIPVIVITAKDLTAEDRKRLNGHVEKILFKGAYRGEDLIRDIREFAAVAAS